MPRKVETEEQILQALHQTGTCCRRLCGKSSKVPARPVENGFIESYNGGLRDECLNLEMFVTQEGARAKLGWW
jgi:hypothetical protein